MKFNLSAPPLPDESAAGHLMRLFEINGAPWRADDFEAVGVKIKDVVNGESDDALRAFGIDPRRFDATTARVGADATIVVNGETLDRDDWLTGVRRWCPKCFEDDMRNEALPGRFPGWRAHRRFWWDAACVATCPVHAVRLERECPTCGVTPKWYSGRLTTCRNGHSLVSCDSVAVAPAHTRADAYLVGRLGGGQRVPNPLLDALPLRDAVDVMERFGAAAIGGANGGLRNIDPARHPEAMSVGLDIAAGWPGQFETLLDSLATHATDEAGASGANDVYGELVRWARRTKGSSLGRQVFDRIHAHHAARVAVRRGSAAAAFVDDDSPVHVTWIAEACGSSVTTVARYLAVLGIEPIEQAAGLTAYPRVHALRVVEIFKDLIGIDEASAILGIHSNLVIDLVKRGIVEPIPIQTQVNATHRRFSRADLTTLIERIAGDAPAVARAPKGLKPLGARAVAIGTGGFGPMIEAIFAGNARVRARLAKGKGLQSLLVDPADLRRARRITDADRLLFKDVPGMLDIHPETAWAALRIGLLVEIKTDGFGVVVSRSSVKAFAANYTTASKLAGPSKKSQRDTQRRLAEAGVLPVISKQIHPRCKTRVYKISDLPEDVLAGSHHLGLHSLDKSASANSGPPGSRTGKVHASKPPMSAKARAPLNGRRGMPEGAYGR